MDGWVENLLENVRPAMMAVDSSVVDGSSKAGGTEVGGSVEEAGSSSRRFSRSWINMRCGSRA